MIAELFLEGVSIFSFSDLLQYRSGEYNPTHLIHRIEDEDIQKLILHMIQINPKDRYSASKYLEEWKHVFLPYFSSFLHQYMISLNDNAGGDLVAFSDNAVSRIYYDFDKISMFLKLSTPNSSSPDLTETNVIAKVKYLFIHFM